MKQGGKMELKKIEPVEVQDFHGIFPEYDGEWLEVIKVKGVEILIQHYANFDDPTEVRTTYYTVKEVNE